MDIKKELEKGYSMEISIDTSQVKKELDEVERQLDRIIEKQQMINNFTTQ